MKLSKECIEAIEKEANRLYSPKGQPFIHFKNGMEYSLTNPSIYEKAGLISLEDAFGFAEMANIMAIRSGQHEWFPAFKHEIKTVNITTAQLFQIYQQQKEKK